MCFSPLSLVAIENSPTGELCQADRAYVLTGLREEIATRACRSSVKIGTSLEISQMKTMLGKLVDLRDPWHCAHNRPTIKHLVSLGRFKHLA